MERNKKTLVVASGNKYKIKEFSDMLTDYNVVGYKDLGYDFEIEEDGNTFYDNALIKAKTVSEKLGVMALADDSGICVEALDGAPGIMSARYAGDGDDEHNNDLLLRNLEGKDNRDAKYVCVLVVCFPDGKIVSAEGETKGRILPERVGTCGFGYDPIFYSYDLEESFGTSSKERKNSVSHRYRALCELKNKLKL